MELGELTVSQVNEYLGLLISSDEILTSLCVKGEISNFKYYQSSGHMYFSLVDDTGVLKAVMFRFQVGNLNFTPRDGMKVKAYGKLGVYSQSGAYQLYVSSMIENGAGKKAEEFEKLKKKLLSEGLFDESRKKRIPEYPQRIGVITSAKGAALQDILSVTGRRFKCAEIIICPSSVQGGAAAELCLAVEYFKRFKGIDILIIGRGGGSGEDLSDFNDEALVRLIASCDFPVISAVGHETDFSLCDFVADRRAPTPSAAAEIATPDEKMILSRIDDYEYRMRYYASSAIEKAETKLAAYSSVIEASHLQSIISQKRSELSRLESMICGEMSIKISLLKGELKNAADCLSALDPLSVLMRGYSIVKKDGKNLTSISDINKNDILEITLSDGNINAEVIDKEKKKAEKDIK